MTQQQFDALATLMRMQPDSTRRAVLVCIYVDGMTIGDAARECGLHYKHAHLYAQQFERGLELAREATG